ncbi:MAG: hypothetical protein GY842_15075 [bacterium]|nr:hypothetical protein [bacterium]
MLCGIVPSQVSYRRIVPRLLLAGLGVALAGCGPRITRLDISDHRLEGGTTHYFEEFDDCFYRVEPDGRFDFVARRVGMAERSADARITQIVHVRGIWTVAPGRTYAEDSMINATVSYLIVGDGGGAGFEGGGFVSFREDHRRGIATAKLESAKLAPVRQLGEGKQVFERAEVRGEFIAQRNRRQVGRILSEMRHLFGPLPRYQPPATDAEVL